MYEIRPEAPAGMTFNPLKGSLSGTPLTPQRPTTYLITGRNSVGKSQKVFSLEVLNPNQIALARKSSSAIGTSDGTVKSDQAFVVQPRIKFLYKGNPDFPTGTIVNASVSVGASLIGSTSAVVNSGVAEFSNLGIIGDSGVSYTITYNVTTGYAPISEVVTPYLYQVGDTGPGGGTVFYATSAAFKCGVALNVMCNFLESAPTSGPFAWSESSIQWAASTIFATYYVVTPSSAIGAGCANSLFMRVLDNRGTGLLSIDRYRSQEVYTNRDWCIPSYSEMLQLNLQENFVGNLDKNSFYWTSTWNSGTTEAIAYLPSSAGIGVSMGMPMTESFKIRLVRAF